MIKFSIKRRYYSAISIVVFLALVVFVRILLNHHATHKKEQSMSVTVTSVIEKPMPIMLQLPGSIEPSKTVDIRAQITGTLTKINFLEGQMVNAGQELFEIDSQPFQVKLKQAEATLIKDQAQLQVNMKNEQRYAALDKLGYVSKQDYDQMQSSVTMQRATVKSDQEQVKAAQIDLQYTKIHAPIDGKTSSISVKEGDLVTAASDTPLVTINQMNPVLVDFNIPEETLTKIFNYQNKKPLSLEIWDETHSQLLDRGNLVFIDNRVNKETGTILLKGSVENTKHLLWPGLMVTVKLILTIQPHALVIPMEAVKIGQAGNFVYIVEQNRAVLRKITVDRQIDHWAILSNGLSAGEQVIIAGPPDLNDGSPVTIISTNQKL